MTNALQVFEYEGNTVRTVEKDGEPWFVAKDVCDILGIKNSRDAITELDDDERGVSEIPTPSNGGHSNVNIISESGLYALVFRSNKPEAKAFSRWVRRDVLPQIRKTGAYINEAAMSANPEMLENLLERIEQIQADNDELREQLEASQPAIKRTRGAISGANQIIEKALACEIEDDYKKVLALDNVYKSVFGFSALEAAGFRFGKRVSDYVTTNLTLRYGGVGYMFKFDMPEELPILARKLDGDTPEAIERWKKYYSDVFRYDE